ncbi:hypothetical protein [Bradyrhizobium sp. Tv2a-2]|uniref:hypothetical protein n=1 Tax=Bradyrhizobium sp. Tv2a-2 TaxID=113395 RepID=UPI00055ECDB5|nr:hypothetical protein [Bradyrhizobium sp. Tv2a-2]
MNYLESKMPNVNVALHAGELTHGLVTPERLRSHIRAAVETFGHGVDVMYEDRPCELLQMLADRHIAVEIALTAHFGRGGQAAPVANRSALPLVIATDDELWSRTDMTNELAAAPIGQRAAERPE